MKQYVAAIGAIEKLRDGISTESLSLTVMSATSDCYERVLHVAAQLAVDPTRAGFAADVRTRDYLTRLGLFNAEHLEARALGDIIAGTLGATSKLLPEEERAVLQGLSESVTVAQ